MNRIKKRPLPEKVALGLVRVESVQGGVCRDVG